MHHTQGFCDCFHRGDDCRLFVDDQIIEHHHIAGPQRRHQHLLDIGQERLAVDGTVEDRRRRQCVRSQRRDRGMRLPVTTGRVIVETGTTRAAPVPAEQVGGDATFVEEQIPLRVVRRKAVTPAATLRGDVATALFVGVYRFF